MHRKDGDAEDRDMTKLSIWEDCQREIDCYKWIASELAGCDLGEAAIRKWIMEHWNGYLRARWLDHLYGRTYWIELDRNDFGLLVTAFQDKTLLLDRIMDELKRRYPDSYSNARARVEPLASEVVGRSSTTVRIVVAPGAMVTLVACINIAGLSLARVMARRRELAIRQALGGG